MANTPNADLEKPAIGGDDDQWGDKLNNNMDKIDAKLGAASATVPGIVELATSAEAQAGTDTARAVTPAGLASVTATETRAGLIELATNAEAAALTDDLRALTPETLGSLFARSLGTSGYQKLPGGLILQWGRYTGGASGPTIGYPTGFPTSVFVVVASPHGSDAGSGGGGVKAVQISARSSLTGFTAICSVEDGTTDTFIASSSVSFDWIAVGN